MTLPSEQVITPLQRQLAAEHAARQQRFRAAGRVHASPPAPAPPEPPQPPPDPETVQQWVGRHVERFGCKPVWFSIEGEIEAEERRRPTVALIQYVVALHFGTAKAEMKSVRRTMDVVLPRQIAMYLAKTMTLHSFPEIGRRFGGRDHTTVLHAVRKIGDRMKRDDDLRQTVAALESQIEKDME